MAQTALEPVRELAFFSDRLGMSVSLLQFDPRVGGADIEEEEPWDSCDQFIAGMQR